MWADDRYWMPLFLEGKKFKGKYLFGVDANTVVEKEVVEVKEV
jgi:hypothetical protein